MIPAADEVRLSPSELGLVRANYEALALTPKSMTQMQMWVRQLIKDYDSLRQQLEQANKDAARWRYLQRHCESALIEVVGGYPVDEAIDAALSQEGAKE